jgi:ABC-2 type transport system ATP-binding protein
MISINGLTRRYGNMTAVENITLEVKKGEIFGFLGPNGDYCAHADRDY